MIILDTETSGVNNGKCGIWQIGAIELENPNNYFLEESRIDDEDVVEQGALKVIGKTEDQLRDSSKQSQKQLIENFLKWAKACKEKIVIGQNVGWDVTFIQNKTIKYNLHKEFREVMGHRSIELHTLAQLEYYKIHKKFLLRGQGKSHMDLKRVLEFCGMKDPRTELNGEEVLTEGTPHNALEDCRLEGECYFRLMFGKNLFPEYEKDHIPEYLKK